MNKDEFLEQFTDILQADEPVKEDTRLSDIEEWDSLSKIATIAFFDKNFSIKLTLSDLNSFDTVEDLIKKSGI